MTLDKEYQALIDHETNCLVNWSHLTGELELFKAKQILINLGLVTFTTVTFAAALILPGMWFMIPLVFMFTFIAWALFHNFGENSKRNLAQETQEAYTEWVQAKARTVKHTLEVIYGSREVGDELGDPGTESV